MHEKNYKVFPYVFTNHDNKIVVFFFFPFFFLSFYNVDPEIL